MHNTKITDMITYYSRLMTGRILKPLYLHSSMEDFADELRLLIISVNDGITKGRIISSMLGETANTIPDEIINFMEKEKSKIKGIHRYLKQCRNSWHKKEGRNNITLLIDEAVNVCDKGCEQMEALIQQARKTRCFLWLHP